MKLAVVTGGHPYDVIGFHALLRDVCANDIIPYTQHLEEFASSPLKTLREYDAVLFYFFPQNGPIDDAPGQIGRPLSALESVLDAGTGLVVLHHALLAYPGWETWDRVVGCRNRHRFSYHPSQTIAVTNVAPDHTITEGIRPWEMVDETYCMSEPEGTPLLTTAHPLSMRTLGWVRKIGDSRVACLQSGHDDSSWRMSGFISFLSRSLHWVARPVGVAVA
jgi:hypothetical protein